MNAPDTLIQRAAALGLRLQPMTGALGARLLGLDLRHPLDDARFDLVQAAFDHYLLLTFPDQLALSP